MKIVSWPKLIISIIASEMAGVVGSLFTFSAIPTWYVHLNKPIFNPPNWIFGPVWTFLYLLIGISFYLVWINYKKKDSWALKFFIFHLFLNAMWSIIFFGFKNLGLAFLEIIIMWLTIVFMIKRYFKINKLASYLLIPYLVWVSFASLLNFSIWRLNTDSLNTNVFAQDFNFDKAREDYIFVGDKYQLALDQLNEKRASYKKNPTLSIKEELRLSLLSFLKERNDYIKSYLTMVRQKTKELSVYSRIDPDVTYYENRKSIYLDNDTLEELLVKSTEDDKRYKDETMPVIYYSLATTSLERVSEIKNKQIELYKSLKAETENLVKLGRADQNLFSRWFKDIDAELVKIDVIEKNVKTNNEKIFVKTNPPFGIKAYRTSISLITPVKSNLLTLNRFLSELENVIAEKR